MHSKQVLHECNRLIHFINNITVFKKPKQFAVSDHLVGCVVTKMILFLLLSGLGFAAFYVGRSSKQMPKNWRQFKSEILWQYLGVRGLIEDYYLRKYNRVGELLTFIIVFVFTFFSQIDDDQLREFQVNL